MTDPSLALVLLAATAVVVLVICLGGTLIAADMLPGRRKPGSAPQGQAQDTAHPPVGSHPAPARTDHNPYVPLPRAKNAERDAPTRTTDESASRVG
jgi:hypothetical protein